MDDNIIWRSDVDKDGYWVLLTVDRVDRVMQFEYYGPESPIVDNAYVPIRRIPVYSPWSLGQAVLSEITGTEEWQIEFY